MAYTTIDDPSGHCQGFNFTGNAASTKRSYDGNASSYIPDIYFVKNMNASSHPQHTDSVADDGANPGFDSSYEHTTYGRRVEQQVISQVESDGFTVTSNSNGNGDGSDMMALSWNCGSTATITSTGNNVT